MESFENFLSAVFEYTENWMPTEQSRLLLGAELLYFFKSVQTPARPGHSQSAAIL